MEKYRKKPVVVEAVQFIESKYREFAPEYDDILIHDEATFDEMWSYKTASDGRYCIVTLEGHMTVSEGDYIIKGIQGELYLCKPDIFKQTYEKV